MKQHITEDQLNELSEKGKERFRKEFWKIDEGDLLVYGDYKGRLRDDVVVFKYGMIPADEEEFGYKLLSIGQMIEFLDERGIGGHTLNMPALGWKGKLCDALWEAVKEVLNDKG